MNPSKFKLKFNQETIMTKKEIFERASELCVEHKANKNLVSALTELLEPKKGGATVNVEDVYTEVKGVKYLQCSVSGKWLEATIENFYEDLGNENNKFGGLKRLSRAAEAARKKATASKKATEKAVMEDLLAGAITADKGQEILAAVAGPDFSEVPGTEERPQ